MICPHTKKDNFKHDIRCIHTDGHPNCSCKGASAGKLIPMLGGCKGMECYLADGSRRCPPSENTKVLFPIPDGAHINYTEI